MNLAQRRRQNMNIYIENQIRIMREIERYFMPTKSAPYHYMWPEPEYADHEARAQQERRQRGELNEDTGSSLDQPGFVGAEL